MSLESILIGIVALIIGFIIGFIIKLIISKFEISKINKKLKSATSDLEVSEKARAEMVKQVEEVKQQYEDVRAMLNDAISSITIIKAYDFIDKKTQDKLKKIENTLKDGKASEETENEFKKMIDEINKKNEDYNKGRSESKGTMK